MKRRREERRVKREVGGEEKCSECLRAAQLEERLECEEKCSECLRAAQLEERLECEGRSRASLSHRCGCRQGVMARGSEDKLPRAAGLMRFLGCSESAQAPEDSLGIDQIDSVRVKYRVDDTSQSTGRNASTGRGAGGG